MLALQSESNSRSDSCRSTSVFGESVNTFNRKQNKEYLAFCSCKKRN